MRAFADVAVGVERDALVESIDNSFHADQLRVHVVRCGFGHGRQRVGSDPRPR